MTLVSDVIQMVLNTTSYLRCLCFVICALPEESALLVPGEVVPDGGVTHHAAAAGVRAVLGVVVRVLLRLLLQAAARAERKQNPELALELLLKHKRNSR